MKWLIYGFGAFQTVKRNSSEEIVRSLRDRTSDLVDADFLILPAFKMLKEILENRLSVSKPDRIIGLGANPMGNIRIEKFAFNALNYQELYPSESILRREDIDIDSPLFLCSTFDIFGLKRHFDSRQENADISFDPGKYFCNFSYFTCLDYCRVNGLDTKTVFLHVPLSFEEAERLGFSKPLNHIPNITKVLGEYLLNTKV